MLVSAVRSVRWVCLWWRVRDAESVHWAQREIGAAAEGACGDKCTSSSSCPLCPLFACSMFGPVFVRSNCVFRAQVESRWGARVLNGFLNLEGKRCEGAHRDLGQGEQTAKGCSAASMKFVETSVQIHPISTVGCTCNYSVKRDIPSERDRGTRPTGYRDPVSWHCEKP